MEEEIYNPEACKLRNIGHDRRLTALEGVLQRIFEKLDAFSQRPSWITVSIITFLATGLGITFTALLMLKP